MTSPAAHPPPKPVTRLAPSPTGALHLGNARTFLINWALARQAGWRILLRIEDLDGPRVKPESVQQSIDLLRWLGIDWDEGPLLQSADLTPYERAMMQLGRRGHIFSCPLTRRQIAEAASAPHDEGDEGGEGDEGDDRHELRFPPELRPARAETGRFEFHPRATNYRFLVPDRPITIDDRFAGTVTRNPGREVGDFVLWTKSRTPAYQLAVVVDDARQGVTDVVRGVDLLPSAARQQLIYEALGLPLPQWWHVPLVLGPDGRRLAKRHGDTRLLIYRETGVPVERIIALIAGWCGINAGPGTGRAALSARDFLEAFQPATLPEQPVTFTEDDHRWLISA